MKHTQLLIILIAVGCFYSQKSYAFQCADYLTWVNTFHKEISEINSRHESTIKTAATECEFGRTELLPMIQRTIAKLELFTNCADEGPKAKSIVADINKYLTDVEAELAKTCEIAGKS